MKLSLKLKKQIESEIREMFDGLVEASTALDTNKYFGFFDEDRFVGLAPDGSNWNSIDDLRALVGPGFAAVKSIESLEFTNVQISVIDKNTAVLVNEYVQRMLLHSGETVEDAGGGTQVWSKRTGAWKLVSVSASSKAG